MKRLAVCTLLIIFVIACGLYSIHLGRDLSWDLQNYHLYVPFSFLNNRALYDVAPAQLQSFLNPILDFPFYALVVCCNDQPRLIAFVMGAVHALNLLAITLLAWHLFGRSTRASVAERAALTVLAVVIGATGAGSAPLIGANTGDLPATVPLLFALLAFVVGVDWPDHRRGQLLLFLLAGFLAGIAVGVKITMAIYCIAMAAAVVVLPLRVWPGALGAMGLGGVAGAVLTAGWYWLYMWRTFANPLFPLYNGVFKSPWWEAVNVRDERFLPHGPSDWLLFPFKWAVSRSQGGLVAEYDFSDIRVALMLTLLVVILALSVWRRVRAGAGTAPVDRSSRDPRRGAMALLIILPVAYVIWLGMFSIYRYLIPLELLSGILIILLLREMVANRMVVAALAVVAAVGCVASTKPLDWGHSAFAGGRYIEVAPTALPPDALVVLTSTEPIAHIIPFFDRGVRWVSVYSNILRPSQTNGLVTKARQLIQSHMGPIYALEAGSVPAATTDGVLKEVSLVRSDGACVPLASNLTGETYKFCPVRRGP